MIPVENRDARIADSMHKFRKPFVLDPTLCLYSPQDNIDALAHPRIAAWIDFVRAQYTPALPGGTRHVLLFMPCTKTKPYPLSTEHQAINHHLLGNGFRPSGQESLPPGLADGLEPGMPAEALNLTPLQHENGTVVHRMVISEPLGVVPYEHIVQYPGGPSPATAYDDPGLFENRGNAVSPWRADCTAVQTGPARWKWGMNEKRGYVEMHNEMAAIVAAVVQRIGHCYDDIISWVAPGLTHRSFVLAARERAEHRIAASRLVGTQRLVLRGANDFLDRPIECLPTLAQCSAARHRLAARLGLTIRQAGGVYARGGMNATPLALPEMLDVLVARLMQRP